MTNAPLPNFTLSLLPTNTFAAPATPTAPAISPSQTTTPVSSESTAFPSELKMPAASRPFYGPLTFGARRFAEPATMVRSLLGEAFPNLHVSSDMPEATKKISKYCFDLPYPAIIKDAVVAELDGYEQGFRSNGELPLTVIQRQYAITLLRELKSFLVALGIQTNRIPSLQQIRILREGAFEEVVSDERFDAEATIATNQAIFREELPLHLFLVALPHELIHLSGAYTVGLDISKIDADFNVVFTMVQRGFSIHPRRKSNAPVEYIALEESFTELLSFMLRQRVTAHYREQISSMVENSELPIVRDTVCYQESVIFFLKLMNLISIRLAISLREVFSMLVITYFTHEPDAYDMMKEALRDDEMAKIISMGISEDSAREASHFFKFI